MNRNAFCKSKHEMTRKWTINGPLLSKLLKKNLHYVFPSTFSLRRSPDSPFSCPFGQDTTIRKVFPHLSASTQCRLSATTTCRLLLPLEHSFFRVYYTVLPGFTTHRIYRRVFAGKRKSINLKRVWYTYIPLHIIPLEIDEWFQCKLNLTASLEIELSLK